MHTARDTVDFLRANNTALINDWPAKSPDINPIEHLWDNLDQCVRRRPIPPSNVIQLRQALIQGWKNIPQAEINTLCANDAKQSFTNAEGGHIIGILVSDPFRILATISLLWDKPSPTFFFHKKSQLNTLSRHINQV